MVLTAAHADGEDLVKETLHISKIILQRGCCRSSPTPLTTWISLSQTVILISEMAISPLMRAIFTVVLLPPGGHDVMLYFSLHFFCIQTFRFGLISVWFDFNYFQEGSVEPKEDIKVF